MVITKLVSVEAILHASENPRTVQSGILCMTGSEEISQKSESICHFYIRILSQYFFDYYRKMHVVANVGISSQGCFLRLVVLKVHEFFLKFLPLNLDIDINRTYLHRWVVTLLDNYITRLSPMFKTILSGLAQGFCSFFFACKENTSHFCIKVLPKAVQFYWYGR